MSAVSVADGVRYAGAGPDRDNRGWDDFIVQINIFLIAAGTFEKPRTLMVFFSPEARPPINPPLASLLRRAYNILCIVYNNM